MLKNRSEKAKNDHSDTKPFIIRMRKPVWKFIKKYSFESGDSMNSLINNLLEDFKRKNKKKE